MAKIKGKQIADNTILQDKLNVTTESIIDPMHVTNSEYVKTNISEQINNINYSELNLDMKANIAAVGDIACNTPVLEFPISIIKVKLNGVTINVGETKDCFFSPDGTLIRNGGYAEKNDLLYWNSISYNLDTDDELDFEYLVVNEVIVIAENETIMIDQYNPLLNVKYTGLDGTTAVVIIDEEEIVVGNIGGYFVWDVGTTTEYTFTKAGEFLVYTVNDNDYTIWFSR